MTSYKLTFSRLTILISLVWSLPCFALESELTILFAADMPVIGQHDQGSYASLATEVKLTRSTHPNTLFLFGGNSIGPSPMSAFDSGSHIIDLLNGLGPEAMGVTKREYSYYEEQLSLRAFEAAFPLIATNVFDPLQDTMQDGLVKSLLIKKGEFTIGVMAVVDPNAKQQYLLKRVIVQNIENSIREQSKRLRDNGADFLIVMHGSLFPEVDDLLQQGVIDLTLVKDPFAPHIALSESSEIPNKVLISGAGDIAIVEVSRNVQGHNVIDWQKKTLADVSLDPETHASEADYVRRLDRLMQLPISIIKTPFNTFRQQVRTSENEFANLITDAMREFTGADVAIFNSGGIRGDRQYVANQVFTRKDLIEELPFRTRTAMLEVSGADIIKTLEDSLSDYPLLRGKFPHVSNMKVIFDGSRPEGSRLVEVHIGKKPIQMDKSYTVVTTDYLYNGGDGYRYFNKSRLIPSKYDSNIMVSDIVLSAIVKSKNMSLSKQGRIVNIQTSTEGLN
ncbi:bifunctional metallophosphatase/5'-nucleotidase [Aliiglaciecola litoralis]|uniref:5'-nucleotidase C-terminal domain-containing protein n=1 Tax=Aliiglaciecola litoralis TaxID=582857 RepID=A0ABP3WYV0_9ALTE